MANMLQAILPQNAVVLKCSCSVSMSLCADSILAICPEAACWRQ